MLIQIPSSGLPQEEKWKCLLNKRCVNRDLKKKHGKDFTIVLICNRSIHLKWFYVQMLYLFGASMWVTLTFASFFAWTSAVMQHRMIKEATKAMAPWMQGQPIYAPISSAASSQGVPILYSGEWKRKDSPLMLCQFKKAEETMKSCEHNYNIHTHCSQHIASVVCM